MSPRESVETVLKGGLADRIPFTMYERMLPRCYTERKLRNNGLCVVQRKVPAYKTIWPNVIITGHTYIENGKNYIRTEYETPHGTLYTVTENSGFTTWTHKKLFASREDYKSLLFLVRDAQFVENYKSLALAQEADDGDSFFRPSLALEPMQQLISDYMGTERFCIEWFDNQDEILKLYNALVEKRRQLYRICADAPVLAFNYGGNVTPEILGLERFEKYYVPHYNEAAEILHKKGKLIGVHFDANCKLIAKAISKTQLDYIEAFTPAPDTDMTLSQARKAWPDKVLWINFPSSVHLEPVEEVRRITENLLNQLGSPEKFIMGFTETIPENRWKETVPAIAEVLLK